MKFFGVMLAVLTFCGAMVGGVVGILLPKLSVGISLGFSIALMICSVSVQFVFFLCVSFLIGIFTLFLT
jgi:hypothetical protein